MAVLSGISREKGQELFMQFPKSVNGEKFQEYLEKLRAANGDAKICLFMDNLSVHKTPDSIKKMQQLHYRWVFNVAYSPDYNPIETTFAKVKHRFRCLRG
jgi:transposase|tara:strand:+ start:383 stop:682 length:300 start_codon:yes stop_codon:yes gene_type:complete